MFSWPPPRRSVRLAVVLPSSNLAVHRDLRLKTRLAGEFCRVLAVFRATTLAIYRDPDSSRDDYELFLKVSRFMTTPPYLRVKVYGIDRHLRFAGLLPPLSIYPHNPEGRPLSVGDIRAGLVLNEYGLVDVGWRKPCRLLNAEGVRPGEVILVKVTSLDPPACTRLIDTEIYPGYAVRGLASFDELREFLEIHDLVVNTSKRGIPISQLLVDRGFLGRLVRSESVCLLFGNPRRDFDELAGAGVRSDITVNFIPHQGTLSVRTIEALTASLAILSALLSIGPQPLTLGSYGVS